MAAALASLDKLSTGTVVAAILLNWKNAKITPTITETTMMTDASMLGANIDVTLAVHEKAGTRSGFGK